MEYNKLYPRAWLIAAPKLATYFGADANCAPRAITLTNDIIATKHRLR